MYKHKDSKKAFSPLTGPHSKIYSLPNRNNAHHNSNTQFTSSLLFFEVSVNLLRRFVHPTALRVVLSYKAHRFLLRNALNLYTFSKMLFVLCSTITYLTELLFVLVFGCTLPFETLYHCRCICQGLALRKCLVDIFNDEARWRGGQIV